jgi:hypothetical protein
VLAPFLRCVAIAHIVPATSVKRLEVESRDTNTNSDSVPVFQDDTQFLPGATRDNSYLPAQLGGVFGSYALSLVLVAVVLLCLSKKRREALSAGDEEAEAERKPTQPYEFPPRTPGAAGPRSPVPNFSYPSPVKGEFNPYVLPSSSPTSTYHGPGIEPLVDQRVVAADRDMAQQQLEDIYRYVMEQDEAKAKGVTLEGTPVPSPLLQQGPSSGASTPRPATLSKKEKIKPAHLNLDNYDDVSDKKESRASSILSVLRSPRKKAMKGVSISSPIMTPMSGQFPRQEYQELNSIPPRQYAPAAPPPVPTDQLPYVPSRQGSVTLPLTPEYSPRSTQSIDERIGHQFSSDRLGGHSRNTSAAHTVDDPVSAVSEHSQAPLVGLPSSPKPNVTRFPSLPTSPKPGVTFARVNPPAVIRTGGSLPLRAYEPALTSPSINSQTTKQTVFERMAPLSPMTARTPFTGAAVPYSPYQPYTPCVPITPSLVTRADRKRMKRLEPKTPTLEMVKSSEDNW